MPPVSIARGGLRVSNATSARRCCKVLSSSVVTGSLAFASFCSSSRPFDELRTGRNDDLLEPNLLFRASVHFRPQGRAHAIQVDEALGLGDAPVGGLRVSRALRVEDVPRLDRDRIDDAATGFQQYVAIDGRLARRQECLQID